MALASISDNESTKSPNVNVNTVNELRRGTFHAPLRKNSRTLTLQTVAVPDPVLISPFIRNLFYKGQGDFQLVVSLGNFPKTSCVPLMSLIFSAMILAFWF